MKKYLKQPQFRIGDIVLEGGAIGYQGTFLFQGNLQKFPKRLLEYIRYVYLYDFDENNEPVYRAEFIMPYEHVFQEDYDRFETTILIPALSKAGLELVED